MQDRTRRALRFAGVQAAVVAAVLHFVWGLPRLIGYLRIGRLPDPRPLLFVLSTVVVLLAVVDVHLGGRERRAFAVLVALMLGYLVGYAAWHLGSHGGALFPGLEPLHHGGNPLRVLLDHLRYDRFTAVTVVLEVVAVFSLGALLVAGE